MSASKLDAWRNRPARERWLIGAPVVALAIVGLYLGVIEPMRDASMRMRAGLPALESRRSTIAAQTAELKSAPSTPARALNIVAIQSLLARFGLSALNPALEPAGDNRARLALQRAPFFALWPFFQALQAEHGVRIVSLRIDRLDASQARVEAVLAAVGQQPR